MYVLPDQLCSTSLCITGNCFAVLSLFLHVVDSLLILAPIVIASYSPFFQEPKGLLNKQHSGKVLLV